MMDLSLDLSQTIILLAVLIYIVLLSMIGNKYHKHLAYIQKLKLKYKHKRINDQTFSNELKIKTKEVDILKKKSYLLFSITGLTHLIICIITESNFLGALIPLFIFTFILVGIYWLKGSGVTDSLKNLPGSDSMRL